VELLKVLRAQWDRGGAVAAVVVGAVMLIIGWAGVSGSGLAAEQIPYVISCGVGGLFVLGIGAVLWISADLRDEWHKLDSVEDAIRGEHDRDGGAAATVAAEVPTAPVPLLTESPSVRRARPSRAGKARARAAAP
jgi:hypothetical protein